MVIPRNMRDVEKEEKPTVSWALQSVSWLGFSTTWIPSSYWLSMESHLWTDWPLKLKISHVFQQNASKLWDPGHLCSSMMWVLFPFIKKLFLPERLLWSKWLHCVYADEYSGDINTITVSSLSKIPQRCLQWCFKYIKF